MKKAFFENALKRSERSSQTSSSQEYEPVEDELRFGRTPPGKMRQKRQKKWEAHSFSSETRLPAPAALTISETIFIYGACGCTALPFKGMGSGCIFEDTALWAEKWTLDESALAPHKHVVITRHAACCAWQMCISGGENAVPMCLIHAPCDYDQIPPNRIRLIEACAAGISVAQVGAPRLEHG